jgi:hypothetical protein
MDSGFLLFMGKSVFFSDVAWPMSLQHWVHHVCVLCVTLVCVCACLCFLSSSLCYVQVGCASLRMCCPHAPAAFVLPYLRICLSSVLCLVRVVCASLSIILCLCPCICPASMSCVRALCVTCVLALASFAYSLTLLLNHLVAGTVTPDLPQHHHHNFSMFPPLPNIKQWTVFLQRNQS